MTTKHISVKLDITTRTVQFHFERISEIGDRESAGGHCRGGP